MADDIYNLSGEIKLETSQAERAIDRFDQRTNRARDAMGRFVGDAKKVNQSLHDLSNGAKVAGNEWANFNRRMTQVVTGSERLNQSLTRLRNPLTALSIPLTLLGTGAVKAAKDMDSLSRGMVAVSGSAGKAQAEMNRLREVAKLPGLGFKEAIQGSINLQAAGISADLARRSLGAFGNALATVGKGKSELDGVNLALSQIVSKGKVSAEEINQIAERVPQIRRVMQEAFGTADTEKLQKANITSLAFIQRIVTELEKLPKVTGGAQNSFENLADTVEQSLVPLGNALLRFIVPAIDRIAPIIGSLSESFARLTPQAQNFIIGAAGIAAVLGPATLGLGLFVNSVTAVAGLFATGSALTVGLAGFGATITTVFAATGPLGIAIAGTAVLAGGLYLLSQRTAELSSATLGEIQTRAQQAESAAEAIGEIKALGGATYVTTEEQVKLRAAYEGLGSVAQERLRQITKESELTSALAAELEKLQGQKRLELEFEGAKAVAEFEKLTATLKVAEEAIKSNEEAFKKAFASNDTSQLEGLSVALKLGREDVTALNKQLEETKAKIQAVLQATGSSPNDLAYAAQLKGLVKNYDTLAGAIKSALPQAQKSAVELGNGTTGALKDAVKASDIFKVGADIGQGLVIGMDSKKDAVKAKGAELGKVAAQATRDAVQSKSPSEVFKRIGKDIGEGLIIGIRLKGAEVKKVLADLLKEATETAKEIAGLANPQIFAAKNRNQDLRETAKLQEDVFELLRGRKNLSGIAQTPTPDRLPSDKSTLQGLKDQLEAEEKLSEALGRVRSGQVGLNLSLDEFKNIAAPVPAIIQEINESLAASEAEAVKAMQSYESIKQGLQGIIDSSLKLTQAQKLLKQIGTLPGDYDPGKRAELEKLAEQARGVELQTVEEQRQREQLQRAEQTAQKIGDFFTQAFRDSFERGPKAFFDRLWSTAKETLARIGAEIAKNLVMKVLGIGGGGGQAVGGSSGGFNLGSLFGGGGNSGGGLGSLFGGGGNSGGGLLGSLLGGPGGTSGFAGPLGGQAGSGGLLSGLLKGGGGLGKLGSLFGLGSGAAGSFAGATAGAVGGAGAFAGATATAGATGGGLFAGLAPLLTNPVTAIVAGAIGGGFLLYKLLSGRDIKELRKLVRGEYGVDVKDNKVLKQIKAIGEQAYGKEWKQRKLETVRLDQSKELVSAYAQSTGQQGNKNLILDSVALDPNYAENQIVAGLKRRAMGGPVVAGTPYLVGERRPEVFVPDQSGFIVPSVGQQRGGNGRSTGSAGTAGLQEQIAMLSAAIMALNARISSVPQDHIIRSNPDAVAEAHLEAVSRNSNYGSRLLSATGVTL